MTDDKDKKTGERTPTGTKSGDDLLAEVESWGSAFDALHEEDDIDIATATAMGPVSTEAMLRLTQHEDRPGELEPLPDVGFLEDDLEFTGEPLALGSLLGTPAPLPPVDDESGEAPAAGTGADDDVYTSAARVEGKPPELAPAPTDDELFGDLPAAPPNVQRERRQTTSRGDDGPEPETTRIAEIDSALLAELAGDGNPESTRIVGPDSALLAELARTDEQPRRPAIVRREDLARMRAEREAEAEAEAEAAAGDFGGGDDVGDFGGAEATRIADAAHLESLVESSEADAAAAAAAAEAFFAEQDEPEVVLELDGDFYDDIEIGESDADAPEPPPEPRFARTVRRTTAHIVRRSDLTAPVVDDDAIVMEIDAEPSDSVFAEADVSGEVGIEAPPVPAMDVNAAAVVVQDEPDPFAALDVFELDDSAEPSAIAESAIVFETDVPLATGGGDFDPDDVEGTEIVAVPPPPPPPPGRALSEPIPKPIFDEGLDPVGASGPTEAFADVAPEPEPDEAAYEAEAAAFAEVAEAAPVIRDPLSEADVAPELPPGVFPIAEPVLDFDALALPEQVDARVADLTEDIASQLLLYERELELLDDAATTAALRLEAGRLAEQLGDPERARTHYDEALAADPRLTPALRGMRRVARATGAWDEAVAHLDSELAHATELEARALGLHRAHLLMASGEQDMARVAVGELLDDAPDDPRALLAYMQLAFVDGRDDEFRASLDRLAACIGDPSLGAALHIVRGHDRDRAGDPGAAALAYRAALERDPASIAALTGLAHAARRSGSRVPACAALGQIIATPLIESDPAATAALQWRRSVWADGVDADIHWDGLLQAGNLAPDDPFLIEELAEACRARGDGDSEVRVLLRLAEIAPIEAERAAAYRRAGEVLQAAGTLEHAAAALRRALSIEGSDPVAAGLLVEVLNAAGDTESLIDLDRAAVDADPGGAVFERLRIVRRLVAESRYGEAIGELAAAREAGAGGPAIIDALERALAAEGRHAERIELLAAQAAADSDQIDPEAAQIRAASAAEQYAYDVARRLADAGDEVDATALRDERDRAITAALDAWHKVLDVDAESYAAHAATVHLAQLLGDSDVLEDALARAHAAESNPARRLGLGLRRARALLGQADPDVGRAEEILRELVDIEPGDARAATALLVARCLLDSWTEAAVVLEDWANAAGGDLADELRFRAASMLLERADDAPRAVDLLGHIVRMRPGFAPAADLLQTAQRRSGDVAALVGDMERATRPIARAPRDAGDAFSRLVREAEIYDARVGEADRAVDLYAKALELRPNDPLAREGFARAAQVANEAAGLAELALADLKAAEESGDDAAKADAYEELARVDDELRGDAASALLALESAIDAAPDRLPVVRVLMKAYVRDGRLPELATLLERQIEAAGDTHDAVALSLERARLQTILDHAAEQIHADYERALKVDGACRFALFKLEAAAREDGPSERLAALEQHVARLFADDPRAAAAFLTRAAETTAELGKLEAAIELFKAANEAAGGGGYAPALDGWRAAALSGQLWVDVAESAQLEAALVASDAERVRLHHLAGVALMDRALNGERAIPPLRAVLSVDPTHVDAFVRLRLLFDEQGQHEDLAQLLGQRLEAETDATRRIELHRALAELHRNLLEDRDEAKKHLRAILALVPNDLRSVATLSDICWEQGAWAEAAEALIGRARLERDERILKGIFYRLGTIYAERLPDPKWALRSFQKVLSYDPEDEGALRHLADIGIATQEWQMALGACERLIKLEVDADARVAILHRVGRIYTSGFGDAARAERAYRVALDLAPTNDAALTELVAFYENAGDLPSMRVHVNRVAAAMRQRLDADPADGQAYRVLSRALVARQRAGVPGSIEAARCAAELAVMLNAGEQAEAQLAGAPVTPAITGLGSHDIDDLLFPASVPSSLREMFALLGDKIAKHIGVNLRAYGVGRGDRRRDRSDPVVATIMTVAEQMGVDNLDIYVSSSHPTMAVAEPTSPLSLIVGAQLAGDNRAAQLRFGAGRALKLALSHFAVPARLSVDDFGVLLMALLRQFTPEFTLPGIDLDQVALEQQRLRRLIPSGMIQQLRPFAINVAGAGFDHRAIWAGLAAAGNRAGLLASHSARAAVWVLCAQYGYQDLAVAARDPNIAAILRFGVSDDHARIRAALR